LLEADGEELQGSYMKGDIDYNVGAIGARRYMVGADPDMIETEIYRLLAEEGRGVAAVEAPARAKKLRDRAEECRVLARMMTSAANAASYLNLAEIYDGLAGQQEQLARDIVTLTKTSG
jgi:hypothetical protein